MEMPNALSAVSSVWRGPVVLMSVCLSGDETAGVANATAWPHERLSPAPDEAL